MSKAKHLHATILRGQVLLQQLHPSTLSTTATATTLSTSSSTVAAGSLRLLPTRLALVPDLDTGLLSIHTLHLSQHSPHPPPPCSLSQHHPQRSAHPSLCPHRRALHTSALVHSFPSSASASASAASAATTSASSSSPNPPPSSGPEGQGHTPEPQGSASPHVFTEQTPPLQWTSELPWIDPLTQSAYDPLPTPKNSSASSGHSGSNSASFFDQPFQNTRHNFVFAHGASGFAKHPAKAPTLTPEEDRAYFSVQVGEDSYFRRHDALGVADGVGGWSGTKGANPALYSRKLMHYAFLELEKYDNIEEDAFYDYFNVNPVHILEKSYEQSARDAKKEGLIGSSTACLAILRDDELRIANLGDCGVSIIRRNEFIFRTEEQQHSFNYPYQLGTGSTDSPTDAQVFTVKVESGDIIVMGTDGIFDNLFDEDILEEVVRCVSGIDPNQQQNPYGTGKPTLTSKGVGGLWSGLTSSAAKLASTSSSTIAAMAGKSPLPPAPPEEEEDPTKRVPVTAAESLAALFNNEEDPIESTTGLSPLAAAAVAEAESTALPLSAALYPASPGESASSSASVAAQWKQYERKIPEPSVISEALAKRAKNVSEDTRHHGSPFQSRAMQEGLYFQGGKQDDMSVLVAIIKVAEDSPDRR